MRSALIAIGVLCLAPGAFVLLMGGAPPGRVYMVWGAILVGGIVFERFRYKPVTHAAPGPGWTRTEERFVDDDTGKIVTVYIQTETGERAYVEE